MPGDIVAEINNYKSKKIQAKYRFQELVEKAIRVKAERTMEQLNPSAGSDEDIVAANLSNTYYYLLDRFKKNYRLPKAEPCKRGTSFWHRVAKLCLTAKIDPKVFIQAQFAYFRKTFGKPPSFPQLVTASAVARAVEYQKINHRSEYVVPTTRPADVSLAEKCKLADRRMRAICNAQGMSRLEVYKNLVIPGFLLLPKEYIAADPEYLKAVNG